MEGMLIGYSPTFKLVPMCDINCAVASVIIMDMSLGSFQRHRMSISCVAGEGDAISWHANATALVQFRGDASSASALLSIYDPGDIVLSVDTLLIPTVVRGNASCDAYDKVEIKLPELTFPPNGM
jgi:hypothetical protein